MLIIIKECWAGLNITGQKHQMKHDEERQGRLLDLERKLLTWQTSRLTSSVTGFQSVGQDQKGFPNICQNLLEKC